jgi:hypothetical protein
MKQAIYFVLISFAVTACTSSANHDRPSTKYEEKKQSLEEMERESPLKFLKVSSSYHGNLLNQSVIEGEITNKATLVGYKDINLQISFLDKEGALIEKQRHLLDEAIDAKSTNSYKIKARHVKGAESVSVDVVGAVAEK